MLGYRLPDPDCTKEKLIKDFRNKINSFTYKHLSIIPCPYPETEEEERAYVPDEKLLNVTEKIKRVIKKKGVELLNRLGKDIVEPADAGLIGLKEMIPLLEEYDKDHGTMDSIVRDKIKWFLDDLIDKYVNKNYLTDFCTEEVRVKWQDGSETTETVMTCLKTSTGKRIVLRILHPAKSIMELSPYTKAEEFPKIGVVQIIKQEVLYSES